MSVLENFTPQSWQDFAPHYQALLSERLTRANLPAWLHQGSELEKHVWEMRGSQTRALTEY